MTLNAFMQEGMNVYYRIRPLLQDGEPMVKKVSPGLSSMGKIMLDLEQSPFLDFHSCKCKSCAKKNYMNSENLNKYISG